jgi:hypothetical protein
MPRHPPESVSEFKSRNQRQLILLARALFGPYWQKPVSTHFAWHPNQIQRWVKGEYEPSDEVVEQLAALARRRAAELKRMAG